MNGSSLEHYPVSSNTLCHDFYQNYSVTPVYHTQPGVHLQQSPYPSLRSPIYPSSPEHLQQTCQGSPQIIPCQGSPQIIPCQGSPQIIPCQGSPQITPCQGSPQIIPDPQQIPEMVQDRINYHHGGYHPPCSSSYTIQFNQNGVSAPDPTTGTGSTTTTYPDHIPYTTSTTTSSNYSITSSEHYSTVPIQSTSSPSHFTVTPVTEYSTVRQSTDQCYTNLNYPSPPEVQGSYEQVQSTSSEEQFPVHCETSRYYPTYQARCHHSPEQLTPPNDQAQQRTALQTDSDLHRNCLIAQCLASSNQFAKFFEFVTTAEQFRALDHTGVQQLWLHCLYEQHALTKKSGLTPVDRHRLRKRFPFPASIWNGETTSYNIKQSARRMLALAFSVDQYPSNEEKKHLAGVCDMDYLQICNWFKNRRMREKRLQKERQSRGSDTDTPPDVRSAVEELARLQNRSV